MRIEQLYFYRHRNIHGRIERTEVLGASYERGPTEFPVLLDGSRPDTQVDENEGIVRQPVRRTLGVMSFRTGAQTARLHDASRSQMHLLDEFRDLDF